MGISTVFFNKCHLYEPEANVGLWVVQVNAKFCEKRRGERGKKGEKEREKKRRKREGKDKRTKTPWDFLLVISYLKASHEVVVIDTNRKAYLLIMWSNTGICRAASAPYM